MTNLYLVRHAHSIYTPDEMGRPLSKKGFLDANYITNLLENEDIHIAISSPYKRAFQTIEGVSNHFNLEIQIEFELRERKLSSYPIDDFKTAITKVWEDPSFCLKGGESNRIAQQRGIACIFKILEKHKGKNIVIGTHGNIIVLIMNYFDARYDFDFWKNLQMPDIYKLSFEGNNLKAISRVLINEFL
ncbi:histidine phosphatase family protein [Priestia aryabhattai]|nr:MULTISPECIES: histidine phosphatase family protein [Priestia]HWL25251.1 histidine phosphatase family protein [Ureibacillus sp.]KWU68651.1 phosphoglycerate mutase [Priestia megaterium]MBY0030278.1 histidine phosphatase family protein [Priestia aryabhattai]MED4262294.1 histidine phosphatase family protein [Priestia aryabhattai]QSF42211.1 histidine phosphatase family protein [Priestia megaterium]